MLKFLFRHNAILILKEKRLHGKILNFFKHKITLKGKVETLWLLKLSSIIKCTTLYVCQIQVSQEALFSSCLLIFKKEGGWSKTPGISGWRGNGVKSFLVCTGLPATSHSYSPLLKEHFFLRALGKSPDVVKRCY